MPRGGARPGAGRKPKPKVCAELVSVVASDFAAPPESPLGYLLSIARADEIDIKLRMDAAKAALPYMHYKLGEGGKKDAQAAKAKAVAGKFSAAQPPKLVVSNSR